MSQQKAWKPTSTLLEEDYNSDLAHALREIGVK